MSRPARSVRFLSLVTALLSLALYLATLRPELDWADPAELTLQAYQLGVTHPPGYPVHTFLGRLFILVFPDPAVATNLMSAVCTSLAVGIMTMTALELTGNWYAAGLAGLMFSVVPQVWGWAVTTEVYAVNIFVVALAFLFILRWYREPSSRLLCITAVVFGVSLGSYLANLFLLPAFVFLLLRRRSRLVHVLLFLVLVAVVGGVILSWNYFRSQTLPPIGTQCVPNTLPTLISFLSGAGYGVTNIYPPSFYLQRIVEHGALFGRSFFWLGIPLGVLGIGFQWRKRRSILIGLLVAFGANMGYFTGYGATDYYTMVGPSYLIFSLWIACGIHLLSPWAVALPERLGRWLRLAVGAVGLVVVILALVADPLGGGHPGFGTLQVLMLLGGCGLLAGGFFLRGAGPVRWFGRNMGRVVVVAASVVIVAGVMLPQLGPRLARTRTRYVTTFVLASFDVLPQDAVIVAGWDKLPAMLFFQRAYGLREDITIVEPTPELPRFIEEQAPTGRLYLDNYTVGVVASLIEERYDMVSIYHGWHQIVQVE